MRKILLLGLSAAAIMLASSSAYAGRGHFGISVDLGYFFPFGHVHNHRPHHKAYRHHRPRAYHRGYRHGYRKGYRHGSADGYYGHRVKKHYSRSHYPRSRYYGSRYHRSDYGYAPRRHHYRGHSYGHGHGGITLHYRR